MIGCLRTHVRKQPIIVLYFEFETVLKFYNLRARFCDDLAQVNTENWSPNFIIYFLSFAVSKEEIDMLQADHDQVGQDLYDTKQRLLDQLDANHVLTELKYTGNTGVKMMDQAIF